MNLVILSGRVARSDLRFSSTGKGVCFVTLAVDGYYNQKEKGVMTDFISVTFWGKDAERMAKCVKGSLVEVKGRVSVSSYEKDGNKVFKTEIIGEDFKFLSKPKTAVTA